MATLAEPDRAPSATQWPNNRLQASAFRNAD